MQASVEAAQELLREGFGDGGAAMAATLTKPRLSYNVAIYHRTFGGAAIGASGPMPLAAE